MNSIETLTTFFGWCSVINIGIILLAFCTFGFMHEWAGKVHARVFGVTKEEAKVAFLRVFQQYRLAWAVFNVVPYIALSLMG